MVLVFKAVNSNWVLKRICTLTFLIHDDIREKTSSSKTVLYSWSRSLPLRHRVVGTHVPSGGITAVRATLAKHACVSTPDVAEAFMSSWSTDRDISYTTDTVRNCVNVLCGIVVKTAKSFVIPEFVQCLLK